MTIAACYVSREGVVLGADSTSTFESGQNHYLNHSQKIFEIGENGTIGVVTWGLGRIGDVSYRTFTSHLSDELQKAPLTSVRDAAAKWVDLLWPAYEVLFAKEIARAADLTSKGVARTPDEEKELNDLQEWTTGFCIGGYCLPDRKPEAFEITFDVREGKSIPKPIDMHFPTFWGAPNIVERLIYGMDWRLAVDILRSGKWTGSAPDLIKMMSDYSLKTPQLPIREAIDFVHASIYSTIKGLKFSQYPQTCGGPIEIAVITSDRRFRWVRHKRMDEAIREQEVKV
jgi:20S proteasome alpha/beta subunit